jgi:MoaA/NifB/PqqE/SkfB family radical SAM enzyme/2-polyprenyl-3-methyl-5-hydroxy-6-metoxy-1,4-benzoquinol methylase
MNFTAKCNMGCAYCYVPFDYKPVDPDRVREVVERCHALGTKVITFGGADPFKFPVIEELIPLAASLGLEVHVDTNAVALEKRHYPLLAQHVSWLGLPLDGSTPSVHDRMRSYPGHFEIISEHIAKLSEYPVRLKVNTVVAAENAEDVPNISNLLNRHSNVARWSLYQFWPLERGARNRERFGIDLSGFSACVEQARALASCKVESSTYLSRSGTYFIVSHDGLVYSAHRENPTESLFLGSIFDEKTIADWRSLNRPSLRPIAVDRYSSLTSSSTESASTAESDQETTLRPEESETFASRWRQHLGSIGAAHSALLYPVLLKHAGDLQNIDVCDAGCGDGSLLPFISRQAPASLIAWDINPPLLETAKSRAPTACFNRVDLARPWPALSSSFDCILASNVVMHFTDEELATFFSESSRTLRPSGRLVLAFVDLDWAASAYGKSVGPDGVLARDKAETTLGVNEVHRDSSVVETLAKAVGLKVLADEAVTVTDSPELPERYRGHLGRALFRVLSFEHYNKKA